MKEKVLRRNTNIDVVKCPAAFLVIGMHFPGCAVAFFRLGHHRSVHYAAGITLWYLLKAWLCAKSESNPKAKCLFQAVSS